MSYTAGKKGVRGRGENDKGEASKGGGEICIRDMNLYQIIHTTQTLPHTAHHNAHFNAPPASSVIHRHPHTSRTPHLNLEPVDASLAKRFGPVEGEHATVDVCT